MFDAIKASLKSDKSQNGSGLFKEILKFKPGNTYQVRLVPNPNAPQDTIFHYYNHAWTSLSTGMFVSNLCPTTFGESCPIDAYYLKTYRHGTDSEKKASAILSRKEGWMVNAYVISDPTTPENEGKVKILRYGRELAKIIQSALEGDDVEEFGVEKVFDVANGATLRIKCESRTNTKGGGGKKEYVTYASSKFLNPSEIEVDLDAVYAEVHDLKSVNRATTPADMQRMLDEHFFCLTTGSTDDTDDTDDTDEEEQPTAAVKPTARAADTNDEEPEVPSTTDEDEEEGPDASTDKKLRELLAGLD